MLKLSEQTNMGCPAPTITPMNTFNCYLSSNKKRTVLPKKNPQPPLGFKNRKSGLLIPSYKKREKKTKKRWTLLYSDWLTWCQAAWETNCPSVAHKGSFQKRLMRGSGVRKESPSPVMAEHLAGPPSHHSFSECLFWQTRHLNQLTPKSQSHQSEKRKALTYSRNSSYYFTKFKFVQNSCLSCSIQANH